MNVIRKIQFAILAIVAIGLTGCLDITEEVTYKGDGSGSYTMKMDMSQMKGMMDMMKNMGGDVGKDAAGQEGVVSDMEPVEGEKSEEVKEGSEVKEEKDGSPLGGDMPGAGDLTKMGEEFTKSIEGIQKMKGVKSAVAINDTTNLVYGYTFEFDNIETLNKAINTLNKDKFEGKGGNTFVATKKSFERTSANDLGGLISQAMNEGEEGMEGMDMLKMFFGEMKYKQIYHFDKKVKKSSNSEAEISADGKTVTLIAKPFSDSQKSKSIVNALKLK
jgi:hypothetical protein